MWVKVFSDYITIVPFLANHSSAAYSTKEISPNTVVSPKVDLTFKDKVLEIVVRLDIDVIIKTLLPIVHFCFLANKFLNILFHLVIKIIKVNGQSHLLFETSISFGKLS